MSTREQEIQLQKQFFRHKLAAEKGKSEVLKQVKSGGREFVLLDARDRASYERDHIPGAISMPLEELPAVAAHLDPAVEYVTYCWNST